VASWGGAVLGLFCVLAAVHLAAVAQDYDLVRSLSKPLLMPLLALWARSQGAPRLLVAALLCGCGGDLLLDVGGTAAFLAGMACFAAGHVCYLRLFLHAGSFGSPSRTAVRLRCAAYAAVWAALVVLLWPGLDPGMRVPVALYSVLLAAMAAGAYGLGPLTGTGGALFLVSDTLIATDLADWPQLPSPGTWVMTTYLAAQVLLTCGLLRTRRRAPA
jgi:uncharacterized membrane protein YhhN